MNRSGTQNSRPAQINVRPKKSAIRATGQILPMLERIMVLIKKEATVDLFLMEAPAREGCQNISK
jgi:hypothetical protein